MKGYLILELEYNKEIKISKKLHKGYQYFCDKNHPLSKGSGTVDYHRHVVSLKIGRWIESSESVHHIDGNKLNNNPENLMLVNISEHTKLEHLLKGHNMEDHYCAECGKKLATRDGKTGLCFPCYSFKKRIFNPSKDELEELIWKIPTEKIGKIYGVTGKAVENRCKLLGVKKPERGYWQKINAKQKNITGDLAERQCRELLILSHP